MPAHDSRCRIRHTKAPFADTFGKPLTDPNRLLPPYHGSAGHVFTRASVGRRVAFKDKGLGQRRVNKRVPECPNLPEAPLAQLSQFRSVRQLTRDVGVHF